MSEDEAVRQFRCEQMKQVVQDTYDDLVSVSMADLLGEDTTALVELIYSRLEEMSVQDLALAVIVALQQRADRKALNEIRRMRAALREIESMDDARDWGLS